MNEKLPGYLGVIDKIDRIMGRHEKMAILFEMQEKMASPLKALKQEMYVDTPPALKQYIQSFRNFEALNLYSVPSETSYKALSIHQNTALLETIAGIKAINSLADRIRYWDVIHKIDALIGKFDSEETYLEDSLYEVDYDLSKLLIGGDGKDLSNKQSILIDESNRVKRMIMDVFINNPLLLQLSPREFEELIAELLRYQGYEVQLTKQTRDGGYDMIAITSINGSPLKFLVECKRYRNRPVSVNVVRQFSNVVTCEGATKGIIATTSYFTKPVFEEFSNPYFLDFRDQKDIINWVALAAQSIIP